MYVIVAGSTERVGVGGRVPATGCARGDIMWLLDEPNQPYEGKPLFPCHTQGSRNEILSTSYRKIYTSSLLCFRT